MKITVEIEDSKMRAIQKWTKIRKKSPAVAQALDEFIEQRQRQEFLVKVMAGKPITARPTTNWSPVPKRDLPPNDVRSPLLSRASLLSDAKAMVLGKMRGPHVHAGGDSPYLYFQRVHSNILSPTLAPLAPWWSSPHLS